MKSKTPLNDKTKSLDLALSQIEKRFGQGSIMRLGEENAIVPVETISTGSLSLDIGLGVGGVPMSSHPPMDITSRASKAMVEICRLDGL